MTLVVGGATADDAQGIASMRTAVADDLTVKYGQGHWSFGVTEGSVLEGIRTSCVLVARNDTRIVGTLRLATRKPWAIARECFARVRRPLYLSDMAVDPGRQREGIGRRLLEEAQATAGKWPADAIRLDAYDAPAGAGAFYAKCGYREVGRAMYHGVPLVYFELLL